MTGSIKLGGVAYPLAAGAYTRFDATGGPTTRTGRLAIAAFGGGQRQAVAGDPDRSWDGLSVRAVGDGGGVEPWPASTAWADAALLEAPTTTLEAVSAAVLNQLYLGVGRRLYRTPAMGTANWANLVQVADFGAGAVVTALIATPSNDLIVGLGSGLDARLVDLGTGSHTAWRAGEKIQAGAAYGGQVVYFANGAGIRDRVKVSLTKFNGAAASDERRLDAQIVRFASWQGKPVVVTRRSLWLWQGQPDPGRPDDPASTPDDYRPPEWRGDPVPIFSHGDYTAPDDFRFVASFLGRLWTWLGGRVVSWDGGGDGWQRHPIEGIACNGGCAAGGSLVVALTAHDGGRELWASDGAGWWRLDARPASFDPWVWPAALYGSGGRDLVAFRAGAAAYDLYRLDGKGPAQPPLATSGEWVSSLLDAGEPGPVKRWQTVGATFAAPEARGNAASTDNVQLTLSASVDGGQTWTQAATAVATGADVRVRSLVGDLALDGRYLQLKVRWESVVDWAPVLASVWAEWSILEVPPPKRRWELAVRCSDLAVDGEGQPWPAPGAAVAAALWAAWESGLALPFEDLDVAADPTVRTVRIAHLAETVDRPADRARWAESRLRLLLIEQ